MSQERFQMLSDLGFKWSAPTPSRSKNKNKKIDDEVATGANVDENTSTNVGQTIVKAETSTVGEGDEANGPGTDVGAGVAQAEDAQAIEV